MSSKASKPTHDKLQKLPANARISKRPLLRPSIPSKFSASQQKIYISPRTPFMSAITRIRKSITAVQKRRAQGLHASAANAFRRRDNRDGSRREKNAGVKDKILAAAVESLERQDAVLAGRGSEDIVVQGTGKAIERVLSVAGWLGAREAEEGVKVKLETGSWWAVDDIELLEGEGGDNGGSMMELDGGIEDDDDAEEVPESRMRRLSVLRIVLSVV